MGLQIRNRIKKILRRNTKVLLHEYKDDSGNFDYEKYKQIQEAGNKRKIDCSWVSEEEIEFLSSYITNKIQSPTSGICHGTRQGLEQKWFAQYLNNIDVIGTEISATATDFPNTVQWDFHEVNPQWQGQFDFIYSNSFDHSYDPAKALCSWMSTLKKGGICIIEHSRFHGPDGVNELDPFGATLDAMPFLILKWSGGKFAVREILDSPYEKKTFGAAQYLIIMNN